MKTFKGKAIYNPSGKAGETEECSECGGTGVEKWCQNCGENLSGTMFND